MDRQGRIASNEVYLGGQRFGDAMTISPEMSKNYITDMASQVFFRISDTAGFKDVSKTATYGPYVAVKKSAIPGIENGWYLMVVDVTNRIDGWDPTIRGFYKDLSNSDAAGGNFIKRKPLAKGRYKLLFPVYLDDAHLAFGFYGEKNIRDITIHGVQLFKFFKMSSSIQQQYNYSLVSYYTPYSEVSRTSMGNRLNFGFERSDTENYGYAVCWDNADRSWYIVPVEESAESVSYPGLVYTDNGLIRAIVDEVKTLPEVKKQVSGKLDRFGDDLFWLTDSYSIYAVDKGRQVMLDTVDTINPEFKGGMLPQFDWDLRLPIMRDENGEVGYAISDLEVEQKLADLDKVTDVRAAGTSVTEDGIANIPLGNTGQYGLLRPVSAYGLQTWGDGELGLTRVAPTAIQDRESKDLRPVSLGNLDYAVKAAMCDGKGEAWTSEEQAAARERMGTDKPYELIEEITLTEQTALLTRDKWPNGDAYSFSKVRVEVDSNTIENGGFTVYVRYENDPVPHTWAVMTATGKAYFVTFTGCVENGTLTETVVNAVTKRENSGSLQQTGAHTQISAIRFVRLWITAASANNVGTKIRIYGVRA